MRAGDCNGVLLRAALGIDLVLCLRSEEVWGLTEMDRRLLVEDLGAQPALLAHLHELAREPGKAFRLDFDRQAVIEVDPMTFEVP
jgi:hypothetical protein